MTLPTKDYLTSRAKYFRDKADEIDAILAEHRRFKDPFTNTALEYIIETYYRIAEDFEKRIKDGEY